MASPDPLRAWAYDDKNEHKKSLKPSDRLQVEGYSEVGKEAKTRSKDGWGVETAPATPKNRLSVGRTTTPVAAVCSGG